MTKEHHVQLLNAVFLLLFIIMVSPTVAETETASFDKSLFITDSETSYSNQETCPMITCLGKIQNRSEINWEDITIEAQFFNASGQLVDTLTESNYDQIASAGKEISFRIRGRADKPIDQYVTHIAKVTWASEMTNAYKKSKRSERWFDILISWMPMILLIGVWLFFIRRISHKNSPQKLSLEALQKHTDLCSIQNGFIERLAVAAEAIQKKKESTL